MTKIRIIKLDDFTDYSYAFTQIHNTDKYFEVIDKWGNIFIYDKSEYDYEIYGDYYGRKRNMETCKRF